MSGNLTRRSLLVGAGHAAAYGTLAARVMSLAQAQQAQPKAAGPSLSMNMVFPVQPKAKIDEKLYINKHLPMLREIYGDSVERIEFRTSQSGSAGMPPTSLLASTHIWIRDAASFSKALSANSTAINLDLDAVAKGQRFAQVDRLAASLGEDLAEVKVGSQILTVHFPPEDPVAKWDDKYFAGTHLLKLRDSYGQSAVRRVEGVLGMDQGGVKAKYRATVQLYVRERTAFESVVQSGRADMIDDIKKFTTILPVFNEFRVQAIV